MPNFATARPTSAARLPQPGAVVVGDDRYHVCTPGRPYLVVDTAPGYLYVAELSHTRQGRWSTTELPTRHHDRSYLALVDFRSGEWLPRWVPVGDVGPYRRQLRPATAAAALAYVDSEYARRHR